jgi:hypothetical protein
MFDITIAEGAPRRDYAFRIRIDGVVKLFRPMTTPGSCPTLAPYTGRTHPPHIDSLEIPEPSMWRLRPNGSCGRIYIDGHPLTRSWYSVKLVKVIRVDFEALG